MNKIDHGSRMPPMTMRAAIYARVSSLGQRDKHTIDSQLSTLPPFVASRGWELVDTYVDDGKTAKAGHLEKRDGFARLLADMAARKFDVVVVVDQDRLTRSEDLRERGEVLGAFQRAGVQLAIASSGQLLDLGSSMGDLLSGLQAFFSAEENRKRRERSLRGKDEAARQGRKPGGITPFGYVYTKADGWKLNAATTGFVVQIYERVAAGESCEQIARDFEHHMISRPRGGHWGAERVRGIVHAETYKGVWRHRGIAIAVPRTVSDEIWNAARAGLKRYGASGANRTEHVHLLPGLVFCECGTRMHVKRAKSHARPPAPANIWYYFCGSKRYYHYKAECAQKFRRRDDVEERVWRQTCKLLDHPDHLARLLTKAKDDVAGDASSFERDLADYEKKLDRTARAEATVLERFRRDLVSERVMDAELGRIATERRWLERQLAAAREQAESARRRDRLSSEVLASLERLREHAGGATPEMRAKIVKLLVSQVEVKLDGTVVITFTLRERAPVEVSTTPPKLVTLRGGIFHPE
jgi:DNA invertase Pin-like site-specific DNA recombinase